MGYVGARAVRPGTSRAFRGSWTADAAMVAVVFIWGASFAVVKHAYREVPALPFLGMRFALAALAALPIVVRRRGCLRGQEAWRAAAVLGALGILGYQWCFSVGLERVSASVSTLLIATGPLWTVPLAAAWGLQRPRLHQVGGMILALAGVALLVLGREGGPARADLTGVALTLAAAVSAGAAYAAADRFLRGQDGPAVMAAAIELGGLAILALTLPHVLRFSWERLSPVAWAELLFTALASTVLAYMLWYSQFPRLGAVRGSVYAFLIPLVGVLMAMAFLGERLTGLQQAGALLVLAGVAGARFLKAGGGCA